VSRAYQPKADAAIARHAHFSRLLINKISNGSIRRGIRARKDTLGEKRKKERETFVGKEKEKKQKKEK